MAWVAYKKGGLWTGVLEDAITKLRAEEEIPEAKAFRLVFEQWVLDNFDHGWSLVAPCEIGRAPVGLVFGKSVAGFVFIGHTLWFPWASDRNKYESAVGFLNGIRRLISVQWYCDEGDLDFYNAICRHGVARRVGTSYQFNGKQALFEVIRWDH